MIKTIEEPTICSGGRDGYDTTGVKKPVGPSPPPKPARWVTEFQPRSNSCIDINGWINALVIGRWCLTGWTKHTRLRSFRFDILLQATGEHNYIQHGILLSIWNMFTRNLSLVICWCQGREANWQLSLKMTVLFVMIGDHPGQLQLERWLAGGRTEIYAADRASRFRIPAFQIDRLNDLRLFGPLPSHIFCTEACMKNIKLAAMPRGAGFAMYLSSNPAFRWWRYDIFRSKLFRRLISYQPMIFFSPRYGWNEKV